MSIEKLYDWENMTVAGIISVMVKWLRITHVEFTISQRNNVESTVWYDITVKDEKFQPVWSVSSQRLDLLRERLINALDSRNYREDYLKEKK